MTQPTIALDMDSTLAATNLAAFPHLEGGEEMDYTDVVTWDWGAETWGLDTFLDALHEAWYEYAEIPPMEDGLPETVAELRQHAQVDVVTHQPDDDRISEGKRRWLRQHGIVVDNFVPVDRDQTKAELGYDVYVDDKPDLPAQVNGTNSIMFLRDHRYNRLAEGQYIRVTGVRDVLDYMV